MICGIMFPDCILLMLPTQSVLCICFQIKGIATVAVDAYVVVTWLPPYEASPMAEMIVSSNVTELVPQL